jgi:hypothetical protein
MGAVVNTGMILHSCTVESLPLLLVLRKTSDENLGGPVVISEKLFISAKTFEVK